MYAVEAVIHGASSLHPLGIQAVMGDGSVRFVRESIQSWPIEFVSGEQLGATRNNDGVWENLTQRGVWQSIVTRSGAELHSLD